MAKYLDYSGLQEYHAKQMQNIDGKFADEIAKIQKTNLCYTDDISYEALEGK